MKNVFKGLEINENDNGLTAFAKGGFKGLIGSVIGLGSLMGALMIIGSMESMSNKVTSEEDEA